MPRRKKKSLRTRGCVGKQRFNTQHEVLGFIKRFYEDNTKGHAGYKCKFCSKWHVTTKKWYKYKDK